MKPTKPKRPESGSAEKRASPDIGGALDRLISTLERVMPDLAQVGLLLIVLVVVAIIGGAAGFGSDDDDVAIEAAVVAPGPY